MRRLLSLALLALPLSAQQLTYDTALRVETRDGRVESVPLPLAATANVIVEFRDAPMAKLAARAMSVSPASYKAAFQRFRADVASIDGAEVRWEYFQTYNGASVSVPRAELAKIRALPYVKAVHPDVEMHALADPAPPANVKQVKADAFWTQFGTRGAGVVVAIIDTGIDYTHPALAGRVAGGYDFVNKDDDPMDDNSHGTHVSGIVAGRSDVLLGVAPEATLIAYKVLGAGGSGKESDVLAAVERAVDPNGDGDTRDHVDVANLSLGGAGSPDDPVCVAIDNASALGVVFAIAAGNSGGGHSIGSPGNARTAITVGAVDSTDAVASFSSRGPNTKDLTVKPELCAPGVSIVSSLPGNRYGPLSGTSMATPHVAGAAALLRAAHRDWTPDRVKAALIAATNDIFSSEVMATGGGRIDVLGAGGATIVADPPVLSFGLDSPSQATWTATKTVHVTNRGTARATLTPSVAPRTGQKVSFDPASLTLDPGETHDLNVTVEITNATISTGSATFSGGSQIFLNGTTRIPFAFTKAARATVKFERGVQTTLWFGPQLFNVASSVSDTASETLLKPGTYDYFIYSVSIGAAVSDERIVYHEQQAVDGDLTIEVDPAVASHVITFAGRDENGLTLSSKPDAYVSSGRLFLHPDWQTVSLHLPALPLTSLRISDLGLPRLAITEGLYDMAAKHVVVVNDPLVTAPKDDVTLSGGGADLATADLRLEVPGGQTPFINAVTTPLLPSFGDDPGSSIRAQLRNPGSAEVLLRLAMNGPAVDGYGTAVAVSAGADLSTWYQAPAFVWSGGKLVTSPAPKVPDGFDNAFGFGPLLISENFRTITSAFGLLDLSVTGQAGETRPIEANSMGVSFYRPDGSLVVRAVGTSTKSYSFTDSGKYRIESVAQGFLFPGVPRTTTLSMTFDPGNAADATPPVFTSVALLDGAGNLTRFIDPNGAGALRFGMTGGNVKQVSYRVHGAAAWKPIPSVQAAQDLYLVNLGTLANAGRALYDIRIETADAAGNTATMTYEPVFSVGTEVPPRGRAAAR